MMDIPIWKASTSARRLLSPVLEVDCPSIWKKVWSFKGPSRVSFTIWAGLHAALPTTHLLEETYPQRFHICKIGFGYWESFFRPNTFLEWVTQNVNPRLGERLGLPSWHYIFRQVVHDVWVNHTRRIHLSNFFREPQALVVRSLQVVVDLLTTWLGS